MSDYTLEHVIRTAMEDGYEVTIQPHDKVYYNLRIRKPLTRSVSTTILTFENFLATFKAGVEDGVAGIWWQEEQDKNKTNQPRPAGSAFLQYYMKWRENQKRK